MDLSIFLRIFQKLYERIIYLIKFGLNNLNVWKSKGIRIVNLHERKFKVSSEWT